MKLSHDEIKELFPDYLRGLLGEERREEIESHVEHCGDCIQELELLSDILSVPTPEPGDLFWKTLPQRVKEDLAGKQTWIASLRSWAFRPLPIGAAVVAAVTCILVFTFIMKKEPEVLVPSFKDPFTAELLDYNEIGDKEIRMFTKQVVGDEDIYAPPDDIMQYSYYREFASLNPDELDRFCEKLEKYGAQGG